MHLHYEPCGRTDRVSSTGTDGAKPAEAELNSSPELWAGVECSVLRVGDDFRDQVCETGHADRLSDLDLVAALGIRTMRYPVLWERVAPEKQETLDWRWTDERLGRMRELGIQPIAGLLHHGSGPHHTNLLDPDFPERLATYAAEVAARYPWIQLWTPVNEPLTTARFSCLYGHWYPHRRDFAAFLRATVNQCRGVALAMTAVRRFNAGARLVQTEDVGRIFSTPELAYQAEHENERRWLSLDLLTGRVGPEHPWYKLLLSSGVEETHLRELRDGLGRPDIIGINHYLTTDRFLDDRVDLYPSALVGGNGRQRYVDVEAVRVFDPGGTLGPAARLREVWDRYGLPMAVTEAHNACTREEQLRWFMEVWQAVQTLRADGADIRATTLWSIFGAVDWSSLLTRRDGVQEPGLFDLGGAIPRRTLLAKAAAELTARGCFSHPVLDTPGWWHREGRYLSAPAVLSPPGLAAKARPIVLTGASECLRRGFTRACNMRGLSYIFHASEEADADLLAGALDQYQAWAVIDLPGFLHASQTAGGADRVSKRHVIRTERLALACAERELPLVTFSSDRVFDGRAGRPYVENDPISPACHFGTELHEAEQRVLADRSGLVIRSGALFSPWDKCNVVWHALHEAARGNTLVVDDAQIISPTYAPDLVGAALDLLLDGDCGLWHVANPAAISWYEFARKAVAKAGLDPSLIRRPAVCGPPGNTALSSTRGVLLRPFDAALSDYIHNAELSWIVQGCPPADGDNREN